jgi:hypothetical protein
VVDVVTLAREVFNELRHRRSVELRLGIRSARAGPWVVNAVRFIRQYEVGQGDYARERDAFLRTGTPRHS